VEALPSVMESPKAMTVSASGGASTRMLLRNTRAVVMPFGMKSRGVTLPVAMKPVCRASQ
jgi:hypothetical protein